MKIRALCFLAAFSLSLAAAPARAADQFDPLEEWWFDRYTRPVQELVARGLSMLGVSYKRGGNTQDTGVDCSGFVRLVYADALGLNLPRTSREMSEVGEKVAKDDLKPGDLVFFNTLRRTFSHVGIYLGNNRFMHSPRTGAEVRVEDMTQSYWVKRYNGARRVMENGGEAAAQAPLATNVGGLTLAPTLSTQPAAPAVK